MIFLNNGNSFSFVFLKTKLFTDLPLSQHEGDKRRGGGGGMYIKVFQGFSCTCVYIRQFTG